MANLVALAALFQGATLFAERQLGEGQSIKVGLRPAGAIGAEMPRVIFPCGTILHARILVSRSLVLQEVFFWWLTK